jgi:hypothetical protein
MTARSFCYLALAAALTAIPACAADNSATQEDTGASADEIISNAGGLRNMTIVKGAVAEGGQVEVAYEPSLYEPSATLPFLAIEIVPKAAIAPDQGTNGPGGGGIRPQNNAFGQTMNVSVTGDFPGSPRVLIVDENFRVLAGTNGMTNEFGQDQANLVVPATGGKKMILVRDQRWVRPMSFMVNAGML